MKSSVNNSSSDLPKHVKCASASEEQLIGTCFTRSLVRCGIFPQLLRPITVHCTRMSTVQCSVQSFSENTLYLLKLMRCASCRENVVQLVSSHSALRPQHTAFLCLCEEPSFLKSGAPQRQTTLEPQEPRSTREQRSYE